MNEAVLRGSPDRRAQALWHATDLLIAGRYTEEEVWIFGEVIGRLADEIELAVRVKVAKRLAHFDDAPFNVITKLALDDSIDVAGPVLQHSKRLDAKTLVTAIRTKSQPHLLAISRRDSIPVAVTDELVTRGNREVVHSVATNNGARFSDFGFLHMVKRSDGDSILAEHLGLRREIPRRVFQQLISKASEEVKRKLARERPDISNQIQTSVTDVTATLQSKFGPASKNYFAAKRTVGVLHRYGNLNENSMLEYARSHRIEEATVGLSLLCSLPVDVIERTLVDNNRELTLILAKALDFAWETAMALLFLGAKSHRISARDLDDMKGDFTHLNTETSRSVLKFYQSRKNAAAIENDSRRLPPLHAVGG
jgi:uncharacterized protein (DUF2336 family)